MMVAVYIFAAFCAGSLLLKLAATAQAWWYRLVAYPRLRRQMDPSYRPTVSVYLPCKGLEPGFDENLDALADLDYPCYDVVCVTEAADDPAVAAIEAAQARHPGRFLHVVAGLATRCGQKNHNLLAAIAAHGGADVYLFCDAKVRPARDWIQRMVEPFSVPGGKVLGVTAMCSGGRFPDWRLPHMLQQQVATWQSIALTSFIGGVWGSSMALRRVEWERLGLRDIWAGTIVDDVTTFSRLLKEGRGSMFAALDAYPNPGYSMRTVAQAYDWGVRQSLYVRYCLPQYWVPTLLENVIGLAAVLWPVALLTSEPGTAWRLLGLVSLGFYVPCLLMNLTIKIPAGIDLPWPRFLALAPLWDVIWMVLSLSASQEDGVAWRGIQYDLDRDGRVLSITRDDVDLLPVEAEAAIEEAAGETAKVTA